MDLAFCRKNFYRPGNGLLETEWPNPLENPLAAQLGVIQVGIQAQTWILATDCGSGIIGLHHVRPVTIRYSKWRECGP